MKENLLIILAFIGALFGLLVLFFLSETLTYEEKSIEKINSERLSEMIKIKGSISHVRHSDNITFITIAQESTIDVVVFDSIGVITGDYIEVIGLSEEYQNEMEIIGHRIRII